MLDLQSIANHSNATFNQLPLVPEILAESDIFSKKLSPHIEYTKHIIPCLHEPKTIIAYDVQTGNLITKDTQDQVSEIKRQLESDGFKIFSPAFEIPISVIQEIGNEYPEL